MNFAPAFLYGRCLRLLPRTALLLMLSLPSFGVVAAPGAHGPNGEHLDAPAAATTAASTAPRMEARSETFELVAHLRSDELSMLINRFETNEPVLDAKVEVESGPVKAVAKFHADMGDYAIDEPAFLKALQAPGQHSLVITVIAGADADLLEGTLQTNVESSSDHGHAHGIPKVVWIAFALVTVMLGVVLMKRRARKPAGGVQ